jgi:prepilin-type N-terminal cleavage/methylation domain-containing protein
MGAPDTPRTGSSGEGGFTFIEMLVVVTVLAILMAVIVPVYGNSISAMKARSARGDFVATVLFAQELAVRESREIRVCLDEADRAYWLEGWVSGHGEDKIFEPIADGAQSGVRHFPESIALAQLRAREDRKRDLHYIACFPNGACDRARVTLSGVGRGDGKVTIATTGTLGGMEVGS